MTYHDVLHSILSRADTAEMLLGWREVTEWPEGIRELLCAMGVLRPASPASTLDCSDCERECPAAPVMIVERPNGTRQVYLECPEYTRVEQPIESLSRWQVDIEGLVAWTAGELGAVGGVEEVLQGRLWWLGGPEVSQRREDVFLARGAVWTDARGVFAHVGRLKECRSPVVLVPSEIPTDYPFGASATVLSLARLLSMGVDSLQFDVGEIERSVHTGRATRVRGVNPFPTPPGTLWKQIVIQLVTDNVVEISAGPVSERRSYEDMGFADRRTTADRPDDLWGLLALLAELGGELGWDEAKKLDEPRKLEKRISRLRKRLQFYFALADDPFEPYEKHDGYHAKFIIIDRR